MRKEPAANAAGVIDELDGTSQQPPLALTSSRQISSARRFCLPLGATAPVSAMPKPTLIGWAARAGIVAQWTTAHKIASGTHKTARRVVANIELISSRAMTAATARRLARFWSRGQKSNAAGRGATPSKGG